MVIWTVEEVASKLNLKPVRASGQIEWHGANPLGHGATDDGFILYPSGNAWDRAIDVRYKSKEIAEMAGLSKEEYLPCVEYMEANGASHTMSSPQRLPTDSKPNLTILKPVQAKKQKAFDTRSLEERGVRPETMSYFQIVFQKGTYWEYPTIHSSGELGRHRWKFKDPVAYWRPSKPNKNIWSPEDSRGSIPVAYNMASAAGKETVYLVNGEVSVWVCHQAGITAIAPFGEGKSQKSYNDITKELANIGVTKLVIVLDNDDKGHKGSVRAKIAAEENDLEAVVMEMIGKDGRDVSDLYEDCGFDDQKFLDALESLPMAIPKTLMEWETGFAEQAILEPVERPQSTSKKSGGQEEDKMAKAQALVELIMERIEVFMADDTMTYASVPVGAHRETHDISSSDFSKYLRMEWRRAKGGKVLDSTTIKDAVADIESRAYFSDARKSIAVRSAMHEGKIYIDLMNREWEVVEIDDKGWRVIGDSPVHFRRANGMEPLPYPEEGGDLMELKEVLNSEDEDEWIKMMAWLITAMRPPIAPYPVASIHGEQGSAKSMACKVLRQLIDPNFTKLIGTAPVDEHNLAIMAKNSFVIGLDNMSGMPKWLSDTLCSLATEGGFRRRRLHTNDEEMIFKARRPIILNGIDEMIGREDFRNRCIVINLPIITRGKRRDEEPIWRQFEEMHPRILGALFTIMSNALGNLPNVQLEEMPRMADFARWVVAAEPWMPWKNNSQSGSRFMDIYMENVKEATAVSLESSPLAVEIVEMMSELPYYQATPKAMFQNLVFRAGSLNREAHGWPSSPAHLSALLKRIAPTLRAAPNLIDVQIGVRDGEGNRTILIKRISDI